MKFASGDTPVHTILVVDVDRDRPSGVAEQLADTISRAGDASVLVQTDTRSAGAGAGFADVLAGRSSVTELLKTNAAGVAEMIPAGSGSGPDLLAGPGLRPALDALRAARQFVVISAASMPRFGDALAIAPQVDATILVVTSGKTRRPRAIETRDALERVGARILGVVMVETKRRLFW